MLKPLKTIKRHVKRQKDNKIKKKTKIKYRLIYTLKDLSQ